jgi:CheY-like chemotaxis protein
MARVFLVLRDDAIRTALRDTLEAGGHSVTEGPHARAALAQLRLVTRPSVVLVEYTNLWSDGAHFIDTVATDPLLAGRHAYLLASTDRVPPVVVLDRVARRPLAVLPMPCDTQTLIAAVERAAASITPAMALWGKWRRKRIAQAGGRHSRACAGTGTSKRTAQAPGAERTRLVQRSSEPSEPGVNRAARDAARASGQTGPEMERAQTQIERTRTRPAPMRPMAHDAIVGEHTPTKARLPRPYPHDREGAETGRALSTARDDRLAVRYIQGMSAGQTAASADAPDFTHNDEVLQMAWDVSAGATDAFDSAQQEEYVVGWAHGYITYITRDDEVEGAPGTPDTWEDDGGSWLDPWRTHPAASRAVSESALPEGTVPESDVKETTDGVSSDESAR